MRPVDIEVQGTWDGGPLQEGEFARLQIELEAASSCLTVSVEAAFFDDPKPDGGPGSQKGLWNFEVVELFLLGDGEQYLEIELGPHGHYLGLRLNGRRNVIKDGIQFEYSARRSARQWSGTAHLSLDWLPSPIRAANVYAIHGVGRARRYLAANPVPGKFPDFHRLEYFEPLSLGD